MEQLAGVLLALAVLLGIIGTVVPLMPGPVLVGGGAIGYALWAQQTPITIAAGIAVIILLLGFGLKYVVPAKKVGDDVESLPLIVGGILGLIGMFLVPIVGLVLGFVLGVFATEVGRRRSLSAAVPATRTALYAAGMSMLIDLAATVAAGGTILAAATLY